MLGTGTRESRGALPVCGHQAATAARAAAAEAGLRVGPVRQERPEPEV